MCRRMGIARAEQLPPLAEVLGGDVVHACAALIGCVIARRVSSVEGGRPRVLRARIVEAEAYHMRERGCHAFRGRTARNAVMFGPPGRLYVYFTYGMWHCANIVCERVGVAAAVLMRAAELLGDGAAGGAQARRRMLSGPGLVCQELSLTRQDNGANLLSRRGDIWLYRPAGWVAPELTWTTRIGFSYHDDLPWRCYWAGHPAVSKAKIGALKRHRAPGSQV